MVLSFSKQLFNLKPSAGKPELPRQPGSSAFYDSESSQPPPESSSAAEPESPSSNDNGSNNFFQTLDWEGALSCLLFIFSTKDPEDKHQPTLFLPPDVRSSQDATESQGAGSMNDQEDLSDQSEGDSYSYSAPGGEPLSRDPSEPLFDADFEVGAEDRRVA